jgi:threonine aldolase
MTEPVDRFEFASDNTAAISPDAWAALVEANNDGVPSYGEDHWTNRVCDRVREIFETDCDVYVIFNGTAANSLALAQLCRSFNSVICHENAHIHTDECGGPEFFSGGAKLLTTPGTNGKLELAEVEAAIARQPELHAPKPRVISVTQSTELGTVYTAGELEKISAFARKRSLLIHMDGARFANAVASLGCAPKEITWRVGVDVLCFGGTKNGTAAGELVIFFNRDLAQDFDYRAKQAGQLGSKMRFLSAPWAGLLADGAWLRNAKHANDCARILADRLRETAKLEPAFPREASAVFLRLGERIVQQLHARGWHFYKFIEPDVYRLMCSWATKQSDIDAFVSDVEDVCRG